MYSLASFSLSLFPVRLDWETFVDHLCFFCLLFDMPFCRERCELLALVCGV